MTANCLMPYHPRLPLTSKCFSVFCRQTFHSQIGRNMVIRTVYFYDIFDMIYICCVQFKFICSLSYAYLVNQPQVSITDKIVMWSPQEMGVLGITLGGPLVNGRERKGSSLVENKCCVFLFAEILQTKLWIDQPYLSAMLSQLGKRNESIFPKHVGT